MAHETAIDPIDLDTRRRRIGAKRKFGLTWTVVAKKIKAHPVAIAKALKPERYPSNGELLERIDRFLTEQELAQ